MKRARHLIVSIGWLAALLSLGAAPAVAQDCIEPFENTVLAAWLEQSDRVRVELEGMDNEGLRNVLDAEVAVVPASCGLGPDASKTDGCLFGLRRVRWDRVHAALTVLRARGTDDWSTRAMQFAPVAHVYLHRSPLGSPGILNGMLAEIWGERELKGRDPDEVCVPLWAANRSEDQYKLLLCERRRKAELNSSGWTPQLLAMARSPNALERGVFLSWVRERPDPRALRKVLRLYSDPNGLNRAAARFVITKPTCGVHGEREAVREAKDLHMSAELRASVVEGMAVRGCVMTEEDGEVVVNCDRGTSP